MIPLLLVGASGLAREVIEAARAGGQYEPIAVVDDQPSTWSMHLQDVPVVGGLDSVSNVLAEHPDCRVVITVGKGGVRALLVERLKLPHWRYATIVHPSAQPPDSCQVGGGSVLLAGVVLTAAVSVGRHVVVMPHVTLTHDDVVEDYATLCAAVTLGGGVRIGTRAYVGMSASVRENVAIGADSTIGMGAVILAEVPVGETWAGVPGHRIQTTTASHLTSATKAAAL